MRGGRVPPSGYSFGDVGPRPHLPDALGPATIARAATKSNPTVVPITGQMKLPARMADSLGGR